MGKCEEMSEAPVASTIDVSRETLLTRLEAATEGTRELDALIVTTLCPRATVGGYIGGDEGDTVFHAQPLGISNKDACPHYTTSLDAALTLATVHWSEIITAAIDDVRRRFATGPITLNMFIVSVVIAVLKARS